MQMKTILLAGLLAFTTNSVFADNIWTSNQGNAAHTGFVAIKTNPQKFQKLWEHKLITSKDTYVRDLRSGIIVDGLAYYLVEETGFSAFPKDPEISNRIVALDTNTGNTVWSVDLSEDTRNASLHYINGMLLLHENKELGGSRQSRMIMFDPKTGQSQYTIHRPATSDYVESDSDNLYEARHYMFWRDVDSYDPKRVHLNWQSRVNTDGFLDGFAVSNHYALSTYRYNHMNPEKSDHLYVHDRKTGADAVVITIDKDKAQLMYGLPVIDDDTNTAYAGMYDKTSKTEDVYSLGAFDLSQGGKIKWTVPMRRYVMPVAAGKMVYVIDNKQQLNAIDAATGKISWSWQSGDDEKSDEYFSPVATANVIFVPGKKNVYAISLSSHELLWKFNKTGKLEIGDNKLFIRSPVYKGDSCSTCNASYEDVTAIALG